MAKVTQALVLVGGKATRLRRDGVDVPLTKAFMMLCEQPVLYWNLCALYLAGIRQLIVAGNHVKQLHEASKVIKSLPYQFKKVDYFHDEGNGVHGLPHELRYLLQEDFVFDCGHGLSSREHYQKLMKMKTAHNLVFSSYRSHPRNIRQPVLLQGATIKPTLIPGKAIAHPIIADTTYAKALLRLKFKINAIIKYYCHYDMLLYVKNTLPPEYDILEEMEDAHAKYYQYITKYLIP